MQDEGLGFRMCKASWSRVYIYRANVTDQRRFPQEEMKTAALGRLLCRDSVGGM